MSRKSKNKYFCSDMFGFVAMGHLFTATDSILQVVPQTMMAASSSTILCNAGESDLCRDDSTAFLLKLVAIASILLAGAAGVSRDVKTGYPDPFRPCPFNTLPV